jgi:hypothetical protein
MYPDGPWQNTYDYSNDADSPKHVLSEERITRCNILGSFPKMPPVLAGVEDFISKKVSNHNQTAKKTSSINGRLIEIRCRRPRDNVRCDLQHLLAIGNALRCLNIRNLFGSFLRHGKHELDIEMRSKSTVRLTDLNKKVSNRPPKFQ